MPNLVYLQTLEENLASAIATHIHQAAAPPQPLHPRAAATASSSRHSRRIDEQPPQPAAAATAASSRAAATSGNTLKIV